MKNNSSNKNNKETRKSFKEIFQGDLEDLLLLLPLVYLGLEVK